MTPGRHVTLSLVAVVLLFLLIFFGACIVLLRPGRERPADVEPTPTLRVIVEPTRPIALPPPPPTVPTPERLLMTPVVVPAPSRTPTPSPVPTDTPTPRPERTPVQKG
jgi:hypothetical protein